MLFGYSTRSKGTANIVMDFVKDLNAVYNL